MNAQTSCGGTVFVCALSLMLLLLQVPGDGWAIQSSPAREIRRLYWEIFQTTEIWVRIVPEHPDSRSPLVGLIFQAFFPGPAKRNPYSGLPEEPQGPPSRLVLEAQPLPLTVIRELSLRLDVDGKTLDLTAPGSNYRNLPCLVATDNCVPNAVEIELEPGVLRSLITARSARGEALGFPIRLAEADQAALGRFAARIGLSGLEHGP